MVVSMQQSTIGVQIWYWKQYQYCIDLNHTNARAVKHNTYICCERRYVAFFFSTCTLLKKIFYMYRRGHTTS